MGEVAALLLKALTFSLLCVFGCVCMYVCNRHLHYATDPLLHFRPSPRSAYLSRGRESETFVASDQQRSSSHALSVGSGVVM